MPEKQTPGRKGVRLYPPPPKDFDPFTATKNDLMRHGLPLRPDPQTQPGLAALWERQAARYRHFEHLEPQPDTTTADKKAVTAPAFGLDPSVNCGYQLFSPSAPFTVLSVIWTVPDLQFVPGPPDAIDRFHTWVSLGFLDVHVEMTVDSAQNVTSHIWAESVGQVNLPVRPGDVMGASLCLDTKPPGTAHYFFTNETTLQTINFTVDTGFPPAVTISAGVTREYDPILFLPTPLARFGVVYFDNIDVFTDGGGSPSLTAGDAFTMVDQNGRTLAIPFRINDSTFKAVYEAT